MKRIYNSVWKRKKKKKKEGRGAGCASVLAFSLRAVCVTVKKAGLDPHVRRVLIDMAESRSTRRAVPVDGPDRAWE